jgi:hypothetical protein
VDGGFTYGFLGIRVMSIRHSLVSGAKRYLHNFDLLSSLSSCVARLARACLRGPLTVQTYILLGFCAYLLLGPVPQSADIVSASLAWGLVVTILLVSLTTFVLALRIKKRLVIDLTLPSEEVLAGESVRCVLRLPPLSLLPGSFLECSLVFSHAGERANRIRLFGSWADPRLVPIDATFPHRGDWDITHIRCSVGDRAGFVRTTWDVPHQTSVIVAPKIPTATTLPIVSSTQRAGDLVPDTLHRHGDPFDIKPYHPSDGIKKIVWKAFAKSGELLSRHAEASMTPEGFVAIYIAARCQDDDVCGHALAYIQALEECTLEVLVGCEGLHGRSLATSALSAKALAIDCAWDASASTPQSLLSDLESVVDACVRQGATVTLRKLIIFCSGSRFSSPSSVAQIVSLGEWLSGRGIEPIFFLTEPGSLLTAPPSSLGLQLRSLVIEPLKELTVTPASAQLYQNFLSTCLSRRWEVVV